MINELRRAVARWWWVALAALLCAVGALLIVTDFANDAAAEREERDVSPIPQMPTRCRLSGHEAVAHARSLEHMAAARWERVPFALEEAPRALLQVSEAELCYAAYDRVGRLRAAAKRNEYEAEIARRFSRARLLLRVAMRNERLDRARQQIAVLRALLSRARDEAHAYRNELEQLDRAYAAQLIERAEESSQ
jgi:hypothetical protein